MRVGERVPDRENMPEMQSTQPGSVVPSWARITELARQVLRERGLSDPEIEAELHKLEPPPSDQKDPPPR